MKTKQKSTWGSPSDWGKAIGILIAAIGLLGLISSVWTPEASQSAATGFFGSNSVVPSAVILIVGLVIAGVYQFLIKPRA